MLKKIRIDSKVITRLADKAAALRKSDGLEITAAVKQVLKQENLSDNTAHYHAVCSELGKRGVKAKGVKIASVIRRSQHRTDQQKKETQNMAMERNDHLLPPDDQ